MNLGAGGAGPWGPLCSPCPSYLDTSLGWGLGLGGGHLSILRVASWTGGAKGLQLQGVWVRSILH